MEPIKMNVGSKLSRAFECKFDEFAFLGFLCLQIRYRLVIQDDVVPAKPRQGE